MADRTIGRRSEYAGCAMCSIAGVAVMVSAMLSGGMYAPYQTDAEPG